MMVKTKRFRMKRLGLSLQELVVVVAVVLLLSAVVVSFLLSHIKETRLATVVENLENIKISFASVYTANGGRIEDANNDGDFLDDLIQSNRLSRFRRYPDCSSWYLRKDTDIYGKSAYYVFVDVSACSSKDRSILSEIDKKIDDGSPGTGMFRYTF